MIYLSSILKCFIVEHFRFVCLCLILFPFFNLSRYMTLVDGPNEVYMVDRDNTVFHIPGLNFRRRKDLQAHLRDTLLDGVGHLLTLLT